MQDIFYIETVDQASTALKPIRIEILRRMAEPRTCPELAEALGETPQKIYYHVKQLQKAGLVEKVEERRVRGVVEGYYQAVARAYWLGPRPGQRDRRGSPYTRPGEFALPLIPGAGDAQRCGPVGPAFGEWARHALSGAFGTYQPAGWGAARGLYARCAAHFSRAGAAIWPAG